MGNANTEKKKAWERRRKAKLWEEQQGKCYYCLEPMIHYDQVHDKKNPPLMAATVEHLRNRFDPTRQEQPKGVNDKRWALACRGCNLERGYLSEQKQPKEVLYKRSGRFKWQSS